MEILNLGIGHATAKLALDALILRHQAIAANIANVNSEGYRPLRVNFEEQLTRLDMQMTDARRELENIKPYIEADIDAGHQSTRVALDMEIVRLNQNTLKFQALLTALGKAKSMVLLAARDGRA